MRPICVVIQARITSSRLPAKALLPLAGVASAVLCARRAANTGLDVVVAIPAAQTDDALADELERNAIPHIRGDLADVLGRFLVATQNLPDGGIVVRLTADNMFPDGAFVQRVVDEFLAGEVDYLGTHSPRDGLPYGLSAEVFSVDALRAAARSATTELDREHVTPWIKRNCSVGMFDHEQLGITTKSHLRCTLDSLPDYLRLQQVFAGLDDPINISWANLVARLQAVPNTPAAAVPWSIVQGKVQSRMVLGTVQLGMAYDAANHTGQPSRGEAAVIVQQAIEHGVTSIDTARAYGNAEQRLGQILNGLRDRVTLITKLDLPEFSAGQVDRQSVRSAVDASVLASCHALRVQRLDVLMLHRWSHRHQYTGAVWERLIELRDNGVIGQLGASLYTPAEALAAAGDADITYLQIPFNLLDWRWRDADLQQALQVRADLIVHARSALLQGILASGVECWPTIAGLRAQDVIDTLDDLVVQLNRQDRTDLCLAYVGAQAWITSTVVGVETQQQLLRNIDLFQQPILTRDECARVERVLVNLPEDLLNPSRWPAVQARRAAS